MDPTALDMTAQDDRLCPRCQAPNQGVGLDERGYRCSCCGLELAHLDIAANGSIRDIFGWLLAQGTVLRERYQVAGVLGKGGFGVTYLVDDILLAGKRRAVKEIPQLLFDEHETRLLGRLRHPAVPDIIDHFSLGRMVYLVLEFGGSRTLRTELEGRGGRIPARVLLPWIEQVCSALTYLHSQDPPVIHRDLKPENILLDDAGRVMLIDFGIAKEGADVNATHTLGRAVSHGFSPPEQILGTGTDPRSDVYALGAILYWALTGRTPPAAHERITGADLDPPSRFLPEVPQHLDNAICRALELNLNKRQQSISELAGCLALVRAREVTERTVLLTDPSALLSRSGTALPAQLTGIDLPSTPDSRGSSSAERSDDGTRSLARPESDVRYRKWVSASLIAALLGVGGAWFAWQKANWGGLELLTPTTPDSPSLAPPRETITAVQVEAKGSSAGGAISPPAPSTVGHGADPPLAGSSERAPLSDSREAVDTSNLTAAPDQRTEASLALSSAERRQVQAWLMGLGLNPGRIDGELGTATREAIRAWQRGAGLPDSGFLDRTHLDRLRQAGKATPAERAYWKTVEATNSAADLEDFLAVYPRGDYAPLARRRLADFQRGQSIVPKPQVNPPPPSAPPQPSDSRRLSPKGYTEAERRAIERFNNM